MVPWVNELKEESSRVPRQKTDLGLPGASLSPQELSNKALNQAIRWQANNDEPFQQTLHADIQQGSYLLFVRHYISTLC